MDLQKYVAISGLPGIYRLEGQNKNGLIVVDLSTGLTRFVPNRGHNLSPLETISIYVDGGDTVPLKDVYISMRDKLAEHPLPDTNGSADEIKGYFGLVLPNYDRERVYLNDMKKAIRWFAFMNERGLLVDAAQSEEGAEVEEEKKSDKPVVKAGVKKDAKSFSGGNNEKASKSVKVGAVKSAKAVKK